MNYLLPLVLFIINSIVFYSVINNLTEKEHRVIIPLGKSSTFSNQEHRQKFDFTVVSQSSHERVYFLPHWSQRWQGSMAITFFLTEETSTIFYGVLDTLSLPSRIQIIPYLVQNDTTYPINKLRNIAIDHVNTTHFWLADMDMWPAVDLYSTLLALPTYYLRDEKAVTIVPAFEFVLPSDALCITFEQCINKVQQFLPLYKSDVTRCLKSSYCDYFRSKTRTHSYHFEQWHTLPSYSYVSSVKCLKNEIQEPYVVVKLTDNLPRFDERFVNYGKNKVQWIVHLRYAGYKFHVLSQGFAIDVPHPRSNMSISWLQDAKKTGGKTEMHLLMNEFITELKHNYSSTKEATPLCE